MAICPKCNQGFDNKINGAGLPIFYKRKFCSASCASSTHYKHYYIWIGGKRVRKKGQLKEGQKRITNQGYVVICIKGCFRPEHRIIFEKYLGRKLIKGEVIHHRDGNKQNNKIKNLQLLSNINHCFAVETKHSEDICKLLYRIKNLEQQLEAK